MNQVKQIHAYTLRNGIDHAHLLIAKLLQIPDLAYAQALFNLIPDPSVFLYNKLIRTYSAVSRHHFSWSWFLYARMCRHGCPPNQHTFTYLFASCASFTSSIRGRILHAHFTKSGFNSDIFSMTALVDMYAKTGDMVFARQVFEEMSVPDVASWNSMVAGYARSGDMERALETFMSMPCRNVVSWTAIISGYSQNGEHVKALEMFLKMEKETQVKPNEVTVASVLPACANLGAMEIGKRVEDYARKNRFFDNIYVSNAVLELHAKSGTIETARQIFDEIGGRRNLCSWNSMIMGLALHGQCSAAFQLYDQMLREGIRPDDITFVGLLLACSHGGMVVEGQKLFASMAEKFDIAPKLEHYGCMVDLLGRAGKLQEAYDLIQTMPMTPDSVIWGALLGSCSFHKNAELAGKAAEFLFKLEPWNPGNYVILSNIYASTSKWDGVAKLRKTMKSSRVTKAAGYSCIEDGDGIHKFIVEDRSHPMSDKIYGLLDGILGEIRPKRKNTTHYELEDIRYDLYV